MQILKITGDDLRTLLSEFAVPSVMRSVRVAIDDGVKVKVNDGPWTRPLGEPDGRIDDGGTDTDDVTNDDRAGWAEKALTAFGNETGQIGYDYSDPEHFGEIAGDLVCNLFHLAASAGVAPDELYSRALMHFEAERDEESEESEEMPFVHTTCRHCELDIEGQEGDDDWRDRGNNARCNDGRNAHEPA